MPSFPKYIWCQKTKRVLISETNTYVIDDSEYGNNKYKKFDELTDVKEWIVNNNLKNSIGLKLIRN